METNNNTPLSNASSIRSFAIYGLFGTKDVKLLLDKNPTVLIGENGSGKTTILNALYFTLTLKFDKLNSIIFDRIELEFFSGTMIEIRKDDIVFYGEEEKWGTGIDERIRIFINRELTELERDEIFEALKQEKKVVKEKITAIISSKFRRQPYSQNIFTRAVIDFFEGKSGKIEEHKTTIKKQMSEDILYLPTYRRIEEELINLGGSKVELSKDDKRLIQFGMQDVKGTFNRVIKQINDLSIEGFTKMTGELLRQYVDGLSDISQDLVSRIQPDILTIILERVGENIDIQYKERIMDLVRSGKVSSEPEQYKYLANFLSNLIEIYDEQKIIDNNIKAFASICNGYLEGKRIDYNESKVTITIIQAINDQEIELQHLSSGEKQIISLFAKLYLEANKNLIILFDEPELSLSILWQKKLLPDIMKSSKCNLLLAVTHSPFIFENEYDMNAESIAKYIKDL